jgi:xanthine dehydrogenase YagT iron-sulfur-binding subunit
MTPDSKDGDQRLSRRQFLIRTGAVAVTISTANLLAGCHTLEAPAATKNQPNGSDHTDHVLVHLRINEHEHALQIDPRVTLLDLCREHLALTGPKKGCDHGQCGACTMIVNGRRINSCLALAVMHDGASITTVEGLAGEQLHPIQAAFIKHDGFQCGYCTSGQLCSVVALLKEVRAGTISAATKDIKNTSAVAELTDDEIRERMSGNICRCGAYGGIVAAVREVSEISS